MKIFVVIVELLIFIGIPVNETKLEIKTEPFTVGTTTNK